MRLLTALVREIDSIVRSQRKGDSRISRTEVVEQLLVAGLHARMTVRNFDAAALELELERSA